eukprot:TRINITY_DN277_c0_g2_i1.p1 TRINITY_DN277_c0_g2~~TRINITY_DN277_c0_g2_i1.p1  ORF type:complete len:393 (+),score=82.79 TRINITY_DN277_c0_g2_i1:299-1477(+)
MSNMIASSRKRKKIPNPRVPVVVNNLGNNSTDPNVVAQTSSKKPKSCSEESTYNLRRSERVGKNVQETEGGDCSKTNPKKLLISSSMNLDSLVPFSESSAINLKFPKIIVRLRSEESFAAGQENLAPRVVEEIGLEVLSRNPVLGFPNPATLITDSETSTKFVSNPQETCAHIVYGMKNDPALKITGCERELQHGPSSSLQKDKLGSSSFQKKNTQEFSFPSKIQNESQKSYILEQFYIQAFQEDVGPRKSESSIMANLYSLAACDKLPSCFDLSAKIRILQNCFPSPSKLLSDCYFRILEKFKVALLAQLLDQDAVKIVGKDKEREIISDFLKKCFLRPVKNNGLKIVQQKVVQQKFPASLPNFNDDKLSVELYVLYQGQEGVIWERLWLK